MRTSAHSHNESSVKQPAHGFFVAGPAGSLFVDDGGTGGIPVLFLHSFGGSSAHWAQQLYHERHSRRAIAMDFRAHGKSATPATMDYGVASFADDIGAVAEALDVERLVLVGHSLGGAAAIHYAGAHPNRVAGLVLVGAPGKMPAEQSKPIIASIEADYDKVMRGYWEKLVTGAQPAVREQVLAEMTSIPKEPSLAIMRALFADDPLTALARYKGPKLVIYTPQGDTPNDLHNAVPGIAKKRIDGTSHWPHMDKPEEFNRMLDEFLASVK
jgi:pimeloyl-ACP methyl ester carboxylesterase